MVGVHGIPPACSRSAFCAGRSNAAYKMSDLRSVSSPWFKHRSKIVETMTHGVALEFWHSPNTKHCMMMVWSSSYQQYWQRPECHGEMPTWAGNWNQLHSHNRTVAPNVLDAALTCKIGCDHNWIHLFSDRWTCSIGGIQGYLLTLV